MPIFGSETLKIAINHKKITRNIDNQLKIYYLCTQSGQTPDTCAGHMTLSTGYET